MLSKSAEYALRAAVELAQQPEHSVSAEQLATATKVPRRYLHKVLQGLAAADLVRSHPGPGGGYRLKRDPATISILDVVNAVAPIERISVCPLQLPSHTTLCPLHRALDEAYANMEEAFARVSLAEVSLDPSKNPPLVEPPSKPRAGRKR